METTLHLAFEKKLDKEYVTVRGVVSKLLKDDTEGNPHQRWLLEGIDEDQGESVMIIHNLDRFDRAPLKIGDRMEVRGKYIWNDRGGLIHWTHHSVHGEVEGGYIKLLKDGEEPIIYQ